MHVAVAIVGFRNCADVLSCLSALANSTYSTFEVVICENGGDSAYELLIGAAPRKLARGQQLTILKAPRNLGYAGGVNLCISVTGDADAWWILNPDTVPDSNALERLVQRLARGDCDLVGGILYGSDRRVQTLGGRWRPWLARAEAIGCGCSLDDLAPAAAVESIIDFVSGASMLVSRRFIDAVGPMREDYFLYCEEVEWCLRGEPLGMRIGIAHDARVLHHQGATTGSALTLKLRPRLQVYLDERNKMLLTRDLFRGRMPIAAAAAFLIIFFRYGARGAVSQLKFALQGWWAGLMGKRGIPDAA